MGTDHSFTFGIGTSCPAATHLIHEVQGTGLTTPISGTTVTVNAIVVGDFQGPSPALRGFFLQEEDGHVDTDPLPPRRSSSSTATGGAGRHRRLVSVIGRATEFSASPISPREQRDRLRRPGRPPAEVASPVGNLEDWERWESMAADFTQPMTTENFSLGRFGESAQLDAASIREPTHKRRFGTRLRSRT